LQATPELVRGGVVLVDESAEERASAKSAGAGRQYTGGLGKVEMSQVGVRLSYVNLKVGAGVLEWDRWAAVAAGSVVWGGAEGVG
jgi:hypothetical protein